MGNSYDYREYMKSAFGYSDRSFEDLEREKAERERAEEVRTQPKRRGGRQLRSIEPRSAVDVDRAAPLTEIEKLNAMLAAGKRRQITPPE